MPVFDELSPAERARQLRDPSGAVGIAVAEAFAAVNREGNEGTVRRLGLGAGDRLLEVGCGLATMAAAVVASAENVRYAGLDRSAGMIEGARERNATLLRDGRASFHLAEAERMPFEDASFTKVFSIGVIHFWPDPVRAFAEVRRVMRPGALMLMGCLAPGGAPPPFARPEYGFHLRDAETWRGFCAAAGLSGAVVRGADLGPPGGPRVFEVEARA